jgi:DNA-binding MarR family transcriptional regulator
MTEMPLKNAAARIKRRPMPSEHDPESVLRQFRVVFKSVRQHFEVVERQCGVSGSQLWALAAIHSNPGMKVTELAQRMSIHQTTASNLIKLLLQKSLVERHRSLEDGRVVELFISTAGQRIIRTAPKPLDGVLPDALGHLSPEGLNRLGNALGELLQVMKVRVDSGGDVPLADI